MTTSRDHHDTLPLPADELESLADHYDTHDTGDEFADEDLELVDPRPMVSTSLRIPSELREALKRRASDEGMRYTTFLRRVLEAAVDDEGDEETSDHAQVDELAERVAHLEQLVTRLSREQAAAKRVAPRAGATSKKSSARGGEGKANSGTKGLTKGKKLRGLARNSRYVKTSPAAARKRTAGSS